MIGETGGPLGGPFFLLLAARATFDHLMKRHSQPSTPSVPRVTHAPALLARFVKAG
jgi:hypothetical protein